MEEVLEGLENPHNSLINKTVVIVLPVKKVCHVNIDQIVLNYKDYVKKTVEQQFPKAVFDDYDYLVHSIYGCEDYISIGLFAELKPEAKERFEKAFLEYQRKLQEQEESLKENENSVTISLSVLRDFVISNFPMVREIDEENALRFVLGENYEFIPSSSASTRN